MKSMRKHHDLYIGLDVTLLADCLNPLRKVSKKTFELNVAYYFTLPGYAYDVMLKMTGVQLELLSIVDMLQMVERGIRGRKHGGLAPVRQGQQSVFGGL